MDGILRYNERLRKSQIRLLKVLPGGGDSRIRCNLTTHGREDDGLRYNALSYAWGDGIQRELIECQGQVVSVTASLHGALWQCRRDPTPRPYTEFTGHGMLWVDALCINQSDEEEKTAQVREMRSIFSRADVVICWLGPSQCEDALAFQILRSAYNAIEVGVHGLNDRPWDKLSHQFSDDDRAVRSVSDILSRAWFQRIWVVQEISAAQRSVFWSGSERARTEVITHFGWYFQFMPERVRRRFEAESSLLIIEARLANIKAFARLSASARRAGNEEGPSLIRVLRQTQLFKATDPRDKVFAMISFSRHSHDDAIVDYSKSLEEVLFSVASTTLTQRPSSLNLLHFAGKSASLLEVPSWVPTWQEHDESEIHEDVTHFPYLPFDDQNGWYQINEDKV